MRTILEKYETGILYILRFFLVQGTPVFRLDNIYVSEQWVLYLFNYTDVNCCRVVAKLQNAYLGFFLGHQKLDQ